MATIVDLTRNPVATRRRAARVPTHPRAIARVDVSTPENLERLNTVATDWLYAGCSDEGKRKLLEQHDLLAA